MLNSLAQDSLWKEKNGICLSADIKGRSAQKTWFFTPLRSDYDEGMWGFKSEGVVIKESSLVMKPVGQGKNNI